MTEQDDLFGKIDALLEKRAGFRADEARETDDFPLLTEVVELGGDAVDPLERHRTERWHSPDRRKDSEVAETTGALSEVQYARLLAHLERRLEALFREQEGRIEAALRRALREAASGGRPNEPV